jgi:hypothetical protein
MHVHLGRAKRDQKTIDSCDEFTRIAESGSTRCYFYQVRPCLLLLVFIKITDLFVYKPWFTLGNHILEKNMALVAAEKQAFELLRSEVS